MDRAVRQLASDVSVPSRCAIRILTGSNRRAGFLSHREFESVAMLRHCLFVFLFLVKRIIINRLSVPYLEAKLFSGKT